jgi:hypothetical protein
MWDPGSGAQVNDVKWKAKLVKLATYKAKYGDCNVPLRWAEDPSLANWVMTQRATKRKFDHGEPQGRMTSERVVKLTALGFMWDPGSGAQVNDVKWKAKLVKLATYKAKYGDCNVPLRWAEDPQLGKWANDQRSNKRKLDRGEPCEAMTVERAARLTALGFVWDPRATAWAVHLAKLEAYKAEHGNCSVPHRWVEDPGLGKWVSMQRQLKRKLDRGEPCYSMTVERAARLAALGLVW